MYDAVNDYDHDRRAEIAHFLRQGFAVRVSERDYTMLRASRYLERDFTIQLIYNKQYGKIVKIWYH